MYVWERKVRLLDTTPQQSFTETDIQLRKSFLDEAVNVWVLYPEPNKKNLPVIDSTMHFVRMFDSLMKGLKTTQIQGPISHSVFETLTTQRGSNRFICLMSRYFLLSVGSKLKHSLMSVKLELDVYQCHQTKSKRKNYWWKHQLLETGRLFDGCIIG